MKTSITLDGMDNWWLIQIIYLTKRGLRVLLESWIDWWFQNSMQSANSPRNHKSWSRWNSCICWWEQQGMGVQVLILEEQPELRTDQGLDSIREGQETGSRRHCFFSPRIDSASPFLHYLEAQVARSTPTRNPSPLSPVHGARKRKSKITE